MSYRVQLLVYDLTQGMAAAMSQGILGQRIEGVWHTGVQIYGLEFYFGGGIQCDAQGYFARSRGMNPTHTIEMGNTNKTLAELQAFVSSIRSRFTAFTYDLLNNNCNHFSSEVCKFLLNKPAPSFVMDQANIIFSTPGGAMLKPLLEGFTRGAYGQSSTLDPFGGASTSVSTSSSTSTYSSSHPTASLSSSTSYSSSTSSSGGGGAPVVSAVPAPQLPLHQEIARLIAPSPQAVKNVNVELSPMVSKDSSTVPIMIKKILKLPIIEAPTDNATPSLTSAEREVFLRIESVYSTNPAGSSSLSFSGNDFMIVNSVMQKVPSIQMNCLFLLRLMVLNCNNPATLYEEDAIEGILTMLASNTLNGTPSHSMLLCVLSNLLTYSNGCSVAFKDDRCDRAGMILDAAMTAISHEKVEVRLMGTALMFNLTLACGDSRFEDRFWHWPLPAITSDGVCADSFALDEMPPTVSQMVCFVFESLVGETDAICRKRKLSVALILLRLCGTVAVDFAKELGAIENLKVVYAQLQADRDKYMFELNALREISELMA
jgi:hypothetical protein